MTPEKPLTDKQEKFCQKYVECCIAYKAYQFAYDAENMSEGAMRTEAHRLLKLPHVQRRIKELKEDLAQSFQIDQQYIVSQYLKVIEDATEKGFDGEGKAKDRLNWLRAVEKLAKTLGLEEPEKLEHLGNLPLSINIIKPTDSRPEDNQDGDEEQEDNDKPDA